MDLGRELNLQNVILLNLIKLDTRGQMSQNYFQKINLEPLYKVIEIYTEFKRSFVSNETYTWKLYWNMSFVENQVRE